MFDTNNSDEEEEETDGVATCCIKYRMQSRSSAKVGRKRGEEDSVNEHAAYTFLITAHSYSRQRNKGSGNNVGVVEQVAVHNSACVRAGNSAPVRGNAL